MSIAIVGIGTAVPESVSQHHATQLAERLSCETDAQRAWLGRVFSRTGVAARGSVLQRAESTDPRQTLEGFYRDRANESDNGPGTADRMGRYAQTAPALAEIAARRAMDEASQAPAEITHLITVSCTGFYAPGLDVALIQQLAISADVRRLHVGFMGCHAAFNAIEAARAIVAGDANAIVLVCCVELCSLHYAYGWTPDKVVANSLFADGAAAVVIRTISASAAPVWRINGAASRLLPDSLEAMTWRIGDNGFEMTLSPEVPKLVGQNVKSWCEEWLSTFDRRLEQIEHWAVHPGGPKVLAEAQRALALDADALSFSRTILSDHGNMSSTTILFILQAMAEANVRGTCVALGFGPGLMMEGMLLERA